MSREQRDDASPEFDRRRDGAGRREPHPAGEASRGNVEPEVKGAAEEHGARLVQGGSGLFVVEEESGAAAAGPVAAAQARVRSEADEG